MVRRLLWREAWGTVSKYRYVPAFTSSSSHVCLFVLVVFSFAVVHEPFNVCVGVFLCVCSTSMFVCLVVLVLKVRLCVNSKLFIFCVYWVQRFVIKHVVGVCYKRGCDTALCHGIFYGSYAVVQVVLWFIQCVSITKSITYFV